MDPAERIEFLADESSSNKIKCHNECLIANILFILLKIFNIGKIIKFYLRIRIYILNVWKYIKLGIRHFYDTRLVNWYLEERMYVRLGRYSLYGILGLRDVGAIDVNICGGDVISRVALAIRGRSGVGLLRLLQAARIKKIAVIFAGSRQLLLHVIQIG